MRWIAGDSRSTLTSYPCPKDLASGENGHTLVRLRTRVICKIFRNLIMSNRIPSRATKRRRRKLQLLDMTLNESLLARFETIKAFSYNTEQINSIDFSSDGESLISSSDDDAIIVYDCEKGTMKEKLFSKKYGVDTT